MKELIRWDTQALKKLYALKEICKLSPNPDLRGLIVDKYYLGITDEYRLLAIKGRCDIYSNKNLLFNGEILKRFKSENLAVLYDDNSLQIGTLSVRKYTPLLEGSTALIHNLLNKGPYVRARTLALNLNEWKEFKKLDPEQMLYKIENKILSIRTTEESGLDRKLDLIEVELIGDYEFNMRWKHVDDLLNLVGNCDFEMNFKGATQCIAFKQEELEYLVMPIKKF